MFLKPQVCMEYGNRTREHQSGHQSNYWLWTSVLNFSDLTRTSVTHYPPQPTKMYVHVHTYVCIYICTCILIYSGLFIVYVYLYIQVYLLYMYINISRSIYCICILIHPGLFIHKHYLFQFSSFGFDIIFFI